MLPRQVSFSTKVYGVNLDVDASVYCDEEVEELTVSVDGVDITELLSQEVIDKVEREAVESVSDENIALCRADDEWSEKGE